MTDVTPAAPAARGRESRLVRWLGLLLVSLLLCCCLIAALFLIRDRLTPPTAAADLHADLTIRLAEAQQVWVDLDSLWGRLEDGTTLSCQGEQVTRLYFVAWRSVDRTTHPELSSLADRLNVGLRRLHQAADMWEEVCRSSAVEIVPDDAVAARQALTQALSEFDVVATALLETP